MSQQIQHPSQPQSNNHQQLSTHYQSHQQQASLISNQLANSMQQQSQCQNAISDKISLDLQKFALCLNSIQSSLTKVFYRAFHNKLISFYIYSLKQQQKKQRQTCQIQIKLLKQQNWPFKELFYKKYPNQNEQIMFQFINMCAEKIQSNFKRYITFKRHQQAKTKIQCFKNKLGAVLIGLKTYNIYHCKKIKEMRKTFTEISNQIDKEIQNPNLDKIKKARKIDYLNSSQETVKQNINKSFQQLYSSGAWIYEVQHCFKKSPIKQTTTKNMQSLLLQKQTIKQVAIQKQTNEQIQPLNQPKPKTRKRQFQGGMARIVKKQSSQSQQLALNEDQPIKVKGSYQFSTIQQNTELMERPIVAKGKYEIKEQDMQNQFLKENQSQKPNQPQQQHQSPRANKFKDEEKKKLNKRQKYDPRKAIEEQKIRLEEQRKKKIQAQKQALAEGNLSQQNLKKKPQKKINQANKKTPRVIKKELERRQIQSPRDSSKEKTVEKIKSHLTKKNDNSKSIKLIVNNKKVQSKVDCWGPKKDSSQTQLQANQESSYKSKYLIGLKQRNESKISQNLSSYKRTDNLRKLNRDHKSISINEDDFIGQRQDAPKILNKIQRKNTQTDQQQTFQSNYLKKLAQQKQKGSFSYGGGRIPGQRKYIQKNQEDKQDSYAQKIQQLDNNMKRLSENRSSMTNLKTATQQPQRKGSISQPPDSQQTQKKKEQVHRSIQFLEDVYSGQYTDRYNTLKNKLNMLQSTRYIQRDDSIPILLEDSKFIKKMYKDHAFSSLYWPQVRTMETNFLDYIKFSGF